MDAKKLHIFGSILGAVGVTAGAFGAHGLKSKPWFNADKEANWKTATMYLLVHAGLVVAVAQNSAADPKMRRAATLWAVGTTLFSGSIYLLTLEQGPRKLLGPTTPVGGSLMIGGWIMSALKFL